MSTWSGSSVNVSCEYSVVVLSFWYFLSDKKIHRQDDGELFVFVRCVYYTCSEFYSSGWDCSGGGCLEMTVLIRVVTTLVPTSLVVTDLVVTTLVVTVLQCEFTVRPHQV